MIYFFTNTYALFEQNAAWSNGLRRGTGNPISHSGGKWKMSGVVQAPAEGDV